MESGELFTKVSSQNERMDKAGKLGKAMKPIPEAVVYELYKKYLYMLDEMDAYRQSISHHIETNDKEVSKMKDHKKLIYILNDTDKRVKENLMATKDLYGQVNCLNSKLVQLETTGLVLSPKDKQ